MMFQHFDILYHLLKVVFELGRWIGFWLVLLRLAGFVIDGFAAPGVASIWTVVVI